jgi:hypothetical protein
MDSTITLYNSYRNGRQTLFGSFPFYNNTNALLCSVTNTQQTNTLLSIDESYDRDHILMLGNGTYGDVYDGVEGTDTAIHVDTYTNVPLLLDVDMSVFNPLDARVLTYNLLIQ